MYYIHLEGWCLGYAYMYATGMMNDLLQVMPASSVLVNFAGMAEDGALYANPVRTGPDGQIMSAGLFVLIGFILNFILIYRGLNKGIEWFNKWAMPALLFCAVVILVRVLTLPPQDGRTVGEGLGFMWNPAAGGKSIWQHLANAEMWVDATGQIFFTLSVGFGLILTYASYVRRDDDIALSATTAAGGNQFCEVAIAGLMVVPAAFLFLGPQALIETGGSGLRIGFMALPAVFPQMPLGNLWGFLFFFLLFLAAVTSSLSMLQPTIAFLEEGLGVGRKTSVALLMFITAVGAGFIGYLSKGLSALDTVDFWIGSFALYVLATILVIVFGWVLGVGRGAEELDRGAEIRIPRIVLFIIKYVSPVYLLVVFGAWIYQQAIRPPGEGTPSRIQQIIYFQRYDEGWKVPLALGFVALVCVLFMMLAAQTARRWRTQGTGRDIEEVQI
jgi:neurotransmitter:Na+ symporter, NSS family